MASPLERSTRTHIPELDGIRGIAILLVLCVHFAAVRNLPKMLYDVLHLGWAGVDLFFVLSGFLITGILMGTKDGPRYFQRFYRNRVLRIFPLYYCYLAVVFLITTVPLWKEIVYSLYLGNFLSAFGGKALFMDHFWSLAIEEQFYMIWPVIVLRLSPKRLTSFCGWSIAVIVVARFAAVHFHLPGREFIYTLTPLRCDGLLMGSLVACLRYRGVLAGYAPKLKWIAAAGLALLAFGVFKSNGTGYVDPGIERYGYIGVDLIASATVAASALFAGSASTAVLRSRFLRFFGRYSYGIYVLHFPISYFLVPVLTASLPPVFAAFASLVCGTALSVLAALVSWFILEGRCMKYREVIAPSPRAMSRYAA